MTQLAAPKPPAAPPTLDETGAIRVALAVFHKPIDIPGSSTASNVKTQGTKGTKRWTVRLLPAARHFEIVYNGPGDAPAMVAYVHESNVDVWHPAQ